MPRHHRVLVSACLLGAPVRYDGRPRVHADVHIERWRQEARFVPLCPEIAGGLPTPRSPAELEAGTLAADVLAGRGRVLDAQGGDLTGVFLAGARIALDVARRHGCRFALLTDGSPSCGPARIHAGAFDGRLRSGEGVVAHALRDTGLEVFAPQEIEQLAERIAALEGS